MMIETRPTRLDGINVYNMGLPGYLAVIKTDNRDLPCPISPLVLAPDKPLIIGQRDMQRSPEFTFIERIFRANYSSRVSGGPNRRP
jgi:hypothetical protein